MPKKHLTPEIASDLANLFDSLSDPTRILIISALLDGEIGVGDLVERLGLTKSAVSHQLRGLRDKRLIRTRKQGRNVFVCLDDDHVIELFKRGLDHVLHG
jgi:ArsR family transcriptional regulator